MKINLLTLPVGKTTEYHEDVDLGYYRGDKYHVRSIPSCHMDLSVSVYDELVSLSFRIKGEVKTTCAYTLEEIPYFYQVDETINLSGGEDDEFDIVNNEIDIDEILITLIVSNVPFKVIKEGAKLPEDSEDYSFNKEITLEGEDKTPSPFDVLDGLEFDDD